MGQNIFDQNDWLDTHGEALDAMYEGWPLPPPRCECILCGELYNDFEMVAGEDTCIHCWETPPMAGSKETT